MKTVLQLKKLMYLDPVPRADLYNLTATKGLVSHRIRKKARVPPYPTPAQQAAIALWSHPPGGENPGGGKLPTKTSATEKSAAERDGPTIAQSTSTIPRANVQSHTTLPSPRSAAAAV